MEFFKTYKSGLRVVAKQIPNSFTVSLGVYVNVGSVREEKQENGYSHFIEHLLFKGTERRNAQQISEEMDDIGANLNAFTSKDNTCFYTKSASGDLEKCIDLLSDMYFNAKFDADELNKEKNVVLEEIAMNDDRPEDVCQDLIAEAIYSGQKLGQTILGTAQNIEYSDRHSILDFKNKYYIAENTVVSVAGNFDETKLDKLIEKYFEPNFGGSANTIEDEEKPEFSSKFLHQFKDVEQSHISLAFAGMPMGAKNSAPYFMMSGILGGGMSSRLFQSIREQHGLAYSVYSYPSAYKNSGFMEIYCGTNPENLNKVQKVLSETVQKFVDGGISETELKRAKAQSINGLYMSMEDSLNVMMAYGRRMLKLNQRLNLDERIANYQKVTVEDVNNAIRNTFSCDFASCYVGSENKYFDLISKLKFNSKC